MGLKNKLVGGAVILGGLTAVAAALPEKMEGNQHTFQSAAEYHIEASQLDGTYMIVKRIPKGQDQTLENTLSTLKNAGFKPVYREHPVNDELSYAEIIVPTTVCGAVKDANTINGLKNIEYTNLETASYEYGEFTEQTFPITYNFEPGEIWKFAELKHYDAFLKNGREKNLALSTEVAFSYVESKLEEKAKSSSNALGIMQVKQSTADEIGTFNLYDPNQNIDVGTTYLAGVLEKLGDVRRGAMGYNAGPNREELQEGCEVQEVLALLPTETQKYVARVEGVMRDIRNYDGLITEDVLKQSFTRHWERTN